MFKSHGFSSRKGIHPIYHAWHSMKSRCLNPNIPDFKNYGGRGIKVCQHWLESFENFRDDMFFTWQQGLQLDRINNDGNYEPSNCQWSARSVNIKNRRGRAYKQSNIPFISYNKTKDRWIFKKEFKTQAEAEHFASSIV